MHSGRGIQFSLTKSREESKGLLHGDREDNPLARLNLKPAMCPMGIRRGQHNYARLGNGSGGVASCGSGSDDEEERLSGSTSRRGCLWFFCMLVATLVGSVLLLGLMLRHGTTSSTTPPSAPSVVMPRVESVRGSDVVAVTQGKLVAPRKPLARMSMRSRLPPPPPHLPFPPPTATPEPVVPLSKVHKMVQALLAKERGSGN